MHCHVLGYCYECVKYYFRLRMFVHHNTERNTLSKLLFECIIYTHPWQAVGKKRKRNPHSTPTEIHIPPTINNRYDPLTENTPEENTIGKNNSNSNISTKPQPNPRPPPIYIYGVTNYRAMLNNLQEVIEAERFHTKTLSNNTVKVNTHSAEGYRQLVRHLNNENIVHHTYLLKQNRAYRIVLRDLHHSIPTEDIKEELQTYGHTARNIINIRHKSKQRTATYVLRRSRTCGKQ